MKCIFQTESQCHKAHRFGAIGRTWPSAAFLRCLFSQSIVGWRVRLCLLPFKDRAESYASEFLPDLNHPTHGWPFLVSFSRCNKKGTPYHSTHQFVWGHWLRCFSLGLRLWVEKKRSYTGLSIGCTATRMIWHAGFSLQAITENWGLGLLAITMK